MAEKYVYFFGGGKADGNAKMKELLGGKGANLAEMTAIGLPVPPGFTISTEVCDYFSKRGGKYPDGVAEQIEKNLSKVEEVMGRKFGDPENPLLFSVRSGAAKSMPGMMDTVLNLGLNEKTLEGLIKKTGNERFAWDSYRRFVQMFGDVVMNVDKEKFERALAEVKKSINAKSDTDLSAARLRTLVKEYKNIYKKETGEDFPDDPRDQLMRSINAVFKSWNNPRAVTYRQINKITGLLGTAVNVQTMVFGNMGESSGTGVAFTRNPATGENEFFGEFLLNAQGEDVVAGIRTPGPVARLGDVMPVVNKQLLEIRKKLESHYKDVQDFEFTIQEGTLYILQTRSGKRTGLAACRIAVEMEEDELISWKEALLLVEPDQIQQLLVPIFDDKAKREAVKERGVLAKGLNAGPGAATGKLVFTAAEAVAAKTRDESVILVRRETSPDDVGGMHASVGILTATGGMTSHAAVVARQLGKVCVVGCGAADIDAERGEMRVGKKVLEKGDFISIDGFTGEVIEGKIETKPSEVAQVLLYGTLKPNRSKMYQYYEKLMGWADEVRKLRVRTNADTPEDSAYARKFGAEGIGLCRTEHMFFAKDRIRHMQHMIIADTKPEREKALAKLLPMQRADFHGIFKAMDGLPVTIRLLDPPLHEFVPRREEDINEVAEITGRSADFIRRRSEGLHEFNPMLGHRGCRLGVTYPEMYEMQVRAIAEAACDAKKEGVDVRPEIMIPITGSAKEMEVMRALCERVVKQVFEERKTEVPALIGTMIEIPRAAVVADKIAEHAEFFSFGTNDLTQMTFGFSRDDIGVFLPEYLKQEMLPFDPFASLDQEGVGELMKMGIERGRKTRPKLKVGICGEHGGDPSSVEFCHRIGMDYVSCSPRRVPVARMALAHAVLKDEKKKK
jgi:pyruvate,orthophosphate dikinase